MKKVAIVLGALLTLGALSAWAASPGETPGSQTGRQFLARVATKILRDGTSSYLDPALATALGLGASTGHISIKQQDVTTKGEARLIAITLRAKQGRNDIILVTWNSTEMSAFLTSQSGSLAKAVHGTKKDGWRALPRSSATKAFMKERAFWIKVGES